MRGGQAGDRLRPRGRGDARLQRVPLRRAAGESIRWYWRLSPAGVEAACGEGGERASPTAAWAVEGGLLEDPEEGLSDSQKRDRAARRVEAVLFISREPLSARRIAALVGLADATEARTLTRRLNERYERNGQALRVEETAGGYQLMTRPQFARWLRKLTHVPADLRLSQVALETLAIIAYRQPVVRAYVEAVRGANCEEVLRQLLERDLIRIAGRSEDLGRPYVYGTTKRFLQAFGLRSIEHLPKKDWVLRSDVQFANPGGVDSMLHTPDEDN